MGSAASQKAEASANKPAPKNFHAVEQTIETIQGGAFLDIANGSLKDAAQIARSGRKATVTLKINLYPVEGQPGAIEIEGEGKATGTAWKTPRYIAEVTKDGKVLQDPKQLEMVLSDGE